MVRFCCGFAAGIAALALFFTLLGCDDVAIYGTPRGRRYE